MHCKFSESIHKGKSTRNRLCRAAGRSLPSKYASEEEHHPANPHLLLVRIIGGIKRIFRALPLRSSRNCESSVLRKSHLEQQNKTSVGQQKQRQAPADFLHEMCL